MNHITSQPVKRSHHTTRRHPSPPTPKVAGNSPRSVFNTAHKRCNSNDPIYMFERFTWELHAKLHGAHRTTVQHSATSSARASTHSNWQRPSIHMATPQHAQTHKTAPASSHGDRGRGRGRLSRRAQAYSLTPPAVRPETMYFCRYWKSRMTGMAAITEPAAKIPHGAVRESAAHMYMPTASVN